MNDPARLLLRSGGSIALKAGGTSVTRTDALGLTLWTVFAIDAADPFVALNLRGEELAVTTVRGQSWLLAMDDGAALSTTC